MKEMHPLDKVLINSSTTFLSQLFKMIKSKEIDVSQYELDHLCYRVETEDRYFEVKSILEKHGTLINESLVNGRPIAIYKLQEAISFSRRLIDIFELPSPKEGSNYEEGYEHVEFVTTESLDVFLEKYKDIKFDLKGQRKELNKDVRLRLGRYSVKFHELSLEEIIRIEDEEGPLN